MNTLMIEATAEWLAEDESRTVTLRWGADRSGSATAVRFEVMGEYTYLSLIYPERPHIARLVALDSIVEIVFNTLPQCPNPDDLDEHLLGTDQYCSRCRSHKEA